MTNRNRTLGGVVARVLAGVTGLALSAAPATAQNALGDGRALDANTGQNGRANYQRPSFMQELQFRNAIVTGNAPGGLSFRGDLGYRAAGDFSGDLGSDELFAFRRDSLYSGLGGMGIRGTDALQYQFSLTTGSRPPQNIIGNLSYTRDSQYQSSAQSTPHMGGTTTIGHDPNNVDPRGLNLYQPSAQEGDLADALTGTMRSSSSYTSTTTLSPVILSTFAQGIERRPYGLTASPLTGVTASPLRGDRDADASASPPGTPRDPAGDRVRTAYDSVIESLRQRADERAGKTGDASTTDAGSVMDDLRRLREGILNGTSTAPATTDQPGTQTPGQDGGTATPGQGGSPGDTAGTGQAGGAKDPLKSNDPAAGTPYDPGRYQMDERTLELIRAADKPITQLVDPNADKRDLYAEHMRAGERLIADERYFDAEERFARALSLRSGDPVAQIGRIHAQMGAGLVLSASVNLRSLLVTNPEMIGQRYAGRLLPSGTRVDALIEGLRERAGLIRHDGPQGVEDLNVRRSSALLLAYLGFQNNRPDTVREGLGLLREIGAADDRRLADVLEAAWLSAPATKGGAGGGD